MSIFLKLIQIKDRSDPSWGYYFLDHERIFHALQTDSILEFFDLIMQEIEKILSFISDKVKGLMERKAHLREEGENFNQFYKDGVSIQRYLLINYCALEKIIAGHETYWKYNDRIACIFQEAALRFFDEHDLIRKILHDEEIFFLAKMQTCENLKRINKTTLASQRYMREKRMVLKSFFHMGQNSNGYCSYESIPHEKKLSLKRTSDLLSCDKTDTDSSHTKIILLIQEDRMSLQNHPFRP